MLSKGAKPFLDLGAFNYPWDDLTIGASAISFCSQRACSRVSSLRLKPPMTAVHSGIGELLASLPMFSAKEAMHRRTFLITGASALWAANDDSPIELRTNTGKVAASLYCSEKWDKPFLFPIRTVSGKVISRGWPLEPREGDSTDHTWHRGFWYGHGIINGADFWREQGREKTSRLILKSKPHIEGSRVSARP